jgi:hypothetical protein
MFLNFIDSNLRIIRDDVILLKRGEKGVLFECMLFNSINCCQKFKLIKVATVYTSNVVNSFCVEVLEWLKNHNVEWLKDIASIRRQNEYMNEILIIKINDFLYYIAATAIIE